jgi:hypothetical protein
MSERSTNIDPKQRMDEFDACPSQMAWPRPVSRRLDQLVERARAARTDRSELAAAIIAATDLDEQALTQVVIDYRSSLACEVVLDVEPTAKVITLPRPGPGRRRRAG